MVVEQLVEMFENFGFLTRCTQNWWGRATRVNYKPYMDIAVTQEPKLSALLPFSSRTLLSAEHFLQNCILFIFIGL